MVDMTATPGESVRGGYDGEFRVLAGYDGDSWRRASVVATTASWMVLFLSVSY